MKKTLVLSVLVLGLGLMQMTACPKGRRVSFGVKAEANMSNFVHDWWRWSNESGFGASFGGFMKYDINRNFAIQPEILFHFKNSTFGSLIGSTTNFSYSGIEIPIYVLRQWRTNNGKFYIGLAPYVSLGLRAMERHYNIVFGGGYTERNPFEASDRNSRLRRFDFGLGAMIGYEINQRVQINATYKIGLLNTWVWEPQDAAVSSGWRWQTFSLGLGYRF